MRKRLLAERLVRGRTRVRYSSASSGLGLEGQALEKRPPSHMCKQCASSKECGSDWLTGQARVRLRLRLRPRLRLRLRLYRLRVRVRVRASDCRAPATPATESGCGPCAPCKKCGGD